MKTLTRSSLSLPAWLQALPMGGVFMLFLHCHCC